MYFEVTSNCAGDSRIFDYTLNPDDSIQFSKMVPLNEDLEFGTAQKLLKCATGNQFLVYNTDQ
jgi:hypothetical protein